MDLIGCSIHDLTVVKVVVAALLLARHCDRFNTFLEKIYVYPLLSTSFVIYVFVYTRIIIGPSIVLDSVVKIQERKKTGLNQPHRKSKK